MPGEHAAKSALDAVLHDLQGKLLGVPVGRFAYAGGARFDGGAQGR